MKQWVLEQHVAHLEPLGAIELSMIGFTTFTEAGNKVILIIPHRQEQPKCT